MIFQDNVIKEYLKNVYFITGTPCGGKTTVSRALAEKYGFELFDVDERFDEHKKMSNPLFQPAMNTYFNSADEFFGRTVEEYKNWLLNNTREQLEFVLLDFGAVYNGYHSDMTRTICVGRPSEEMTKIYNIVLEAQQAALDAAKAGITGSQLDFAARNIIEDYGYGDCFGHSLGHGVGMEIHEFPNASPKSTAVLKPNEIITIEPGIYIPEKFGVRIEDFVILTENSCENMTKCAKNIISL